MSAQTDATEKENRISNSVRCFSDDSVCVRGGRGGGGAKGGGGESVGFYRNSFIVNIHLL